MSHFAVGAAFQSSVGYQCYIFVKDQYVVLNYGSTKKDIVSGPGDITDGFPMLANTKFDKGIDCAFDVEENDAFIFSKDQCAKIKYTPRSEAKMFTAPIKIGEMFPCLVGTHFEHGIDAAVSYDRWRALLFKGDRSVLLNHFSKSCEATEKIAHRFSCLYGTVFESGIDAAFREYGQRRFYIFKGERCALIDYAGSNTSDYIVGGRITRISVDWPVLHEMVEEEEE